MKCGANLKLSVEKSLEKRIEEGAEEFGRRVEAWGEDFGKRAEKECFGLPYGGAIFGLFIGAIIILWGLSSIFGWNLEIGGFVIIVIGLLIVAGAIYGLTRRRS